MIVENPRELRWKQVAAHAFLIAFIVVIMFPCEQVPHDFGVFVARVVQARKPEPALDRFEQGKVRVTPIALSVSSFAF